MNPLHLLIDGQLVAGDLDMDVINPATEALLCKSPRASKRQLDAAIAAAKKAFPGWRATPMASRAALLEQVAQRLEANVDELARLLTQEQGKPLAEAKTEILYGASYLEWFAEEAKRIYGDTIPQNVKGRRIVVIKEPVGVVGKQGEQVRPARPAGEGQEGQCNHAQSGSSAEEGQATGRL